MPGEVDVRESVLNGEPRGDSDELALQRLKYEDQIAGLKKQLKSVMRKEISLDSIRSTVFGINSYNFQAPRWATERRGVSGNSVPLLLLSDLHWGETVKPAQNSWGNPYNLEIARERLKMAFNRTLYLCSQHIIHPNSPGIVVALGGDMLSGSIHEELSETNAMADYKLVFDLADHLIEGINKLAQAFGRVFIPCMYGNHGRDSHKPRYKDAGFHNLDWLLYNTLERHFQNDQRVSFMVGEGFDVIFRVYNTTFCLTHGDRLGSGGGDLPAQVSRGAIKIKAQYAAQGIAIDWTLMVHFHSPLILDHPGVVVNGSPKGGDEYASGNRLRQSDPTQTLLWVDEDFGVTFYTKVFLTSPEKKEASWMSWPESQQ